MISLQNDGLKRWCGTIALGLRNLMKSTIAPKLSDIVYKKYVDDTGKDGGGLVEVTLLP
jgi:hypothetical protein